MNHWVDTVRRGLRKPPRVIASRLFSIVRTQAERFRLPGRVNMSQAQLLKELSATSLNVLWQRLAARPFPAWFGPCDAAEIDALCGSDERLALMDRADAALAHQVKLLGSGLVDLGAVIDWHTDFKTGLSWPPRYFADIAYNNPDQPSDVKVPWELSRLQWLMPAGQAFLLTGDERYASGVRDVLEQWMESNPCGGSVNWSCTMEAALRIFSWAWFFHVFQNAISWSDSGFQFRFLRALYLHVEFTERHIERSDINGNHYTADAAGLVLGGLFFGEGFGPQRWQKEGWQILCEEISLQVFSDGVDFEASVPYHRLVAELFLWPAMCRTALGLEVGPEYRARLAAMARFTLAYSRVDGSVPLWGDADDARVIPFGCQDINDHRYLPALIGFYLGVQDLSKDQAAAVGEVLWVLGPDVVRQWLSNEPAAQGSASFPQGGFYVMRNANDHVFIDCGPLGLAGRGGHGHNDCLSFEAVLDGAPLITDCGAYLYTASYVERNAFRSTSYHNTPMVDGAEINRFIRPDYLWNLHYDAVPRLLKWYADERYAFFYGEHGGYERQPSPVTPRRTILLDFETHALLIKDELDGEGEHDVSIPLHLAPGVSVAQENNCELILKTHQRLFSIWWPESSGYMLRDEEARVSPSYGITKPIKKLVWSRKAASLKPFNLIVAPTSDKQDIELRLQQCLSQALEHCCE